MLDATLAAAQDVFLSPTIWLVIVASAAYGVFVGAVPGLTATMAAALLVPVTYWLDPLPALAAIVTMVACAIFAGDIPTTLLRIPGTPASAAYADIAHGYTLRGDPGRPLGYALVWSVAGGLFGAVVLMVLGQLLARVATVFSVAEYFWLYLLGLSCAAVVARGSLAKGLLATLIGLLLSTVGLSAVHTRARFTFGMPELYQGINFIPAMIGLFGLSVVLKNLASSLPLDTPTGPETEGVAPRSSSLGEAILRLGQRPAAALRSGSIGAVIGMLPGAGADIAGWVSLAVSKRLRRGRGGDDDLDALADATAANSSALAGAWIPALVFGVPGDSVTAIVIGVLLMKDVTPGPTIFEEQAELVAGLYLIFLLANLVLLPVGWLAIRLGQQVVRVPRNVLLPVVLLFCLLGSYAISGSIFDVGLMIAMGLLGFVLERFDVPLGPVVLGIILGGPLEERFLQTLTGAGGSPIGFVDRPAAAILATLWVALWGSALVAAVRGRSAGRSAV